MYCSLIAPLVTSHGPPPPLHLFNTPHSRMVSPTLGITVLETRQQATSVLYTVVGIIMATVIVR